MNQIPKIIHQTWKTKILPFPFNELSSTWLESHPDWEHIIWTDEMNRDLIKDCYPEFLEKYDGYPRNIQRVDAFRYFVLKKYGGVYVDMDFECFKNIEPLLDGKECVFGLEPDAHSSMFSRDFIVCNAFMASIPNNNFINFVCEQVMSYPKIEEVRPIDVLNSTGPFMLTDSYSAYKNKDKVTILDSIHLYPITFMEGFSVFNDKITPEIEAKLEKAYAVHYFLGNWS